MEFIEREDAKFIRLAFCDVHGTQKNISIMPRELGRAFEQGIPIDASAIPGLGGECASDLVLHPDPATLMPLPWRPEHGRVVQMFSDISYPDGTPFMTIGTPGDPTDAPTLIGPYDFSVGSQSHRIGQGIQTSGELVMNNGTLDIASYFYIGYYSGRYDDCPEIITHPTLTQNGGRIECGVLRLGQANTTYPQNCSPCLRVHAGTFNVRNEIYAS